jgi:hypothetical protein
VSNARQVEVLRIICDDFVEVGEASSLSVAKHAGARRLSKQEMLRALAFRRKVRELIPSEASLVVRSIR